MSESPFLQIPREDWLLSNSLAFAVFDGFPVSRGHALVLTKRLVPTWFEASAEEQTALMSLVNEVKSYLDKTLDPKPDGYNVGFNCGETAGQTVMHVHVHVIPRYSGDVPDPRGSVRFVIPEKANYLKDSKTGPPTQSIESSSQTSDLQLTTGHPDSRLWDRLSTRMVGARLVDILASFVQLSGLDVIERRLFEVLRGEATIRVLVSDYLYISDPRALARLLAWRDAIEADEEVLGVLHVRLVQLRSLKHNPESFHPKAWRIVDELGAFVAVGSSNLSRPALVTGVEWNLLCSSLGHDGIPDDLKDAFDSLWDTAPDFHVRFELQDGSWRVRPVGISGVPKESPEAQETAAEGFMVMLQPSIPDSAKFSTHVPVYDLVAAAGTFGEEGVPEEIGWIEAAGHKLKPGMFAARVVGESMQPRIPSGSVCLFRPCPTGSRQGRLVLVQFNTHAAPEDGGRYTVKRYH